MIKVWDAAQAFHARQTGLFLTQNQVSSKVTVLLYGKIAFAVTNKLVGKYKSQYYVYDSYTNFSSY